MSEEINKLEITWSSLFKVGLVGILFYGVYLLGNLIIWTLFAFIISLLFNPGIKFLERFKIPRVLSVSLCFLGFFGIFGLVVYLTAPLFISEIKQFFNLFPHYFTKISPLLRELGFKAFEDISTFQVYLEETVTKASSDIFSAIVVFFGGLFSTLYTLTIAFFLCLEREIIEKGVALFFPKEKESFVLEIFKKAQKKVSAWFGATLLSCLFIGVASFIALTILNVKYSFIFALLAGLFSFLPVIGPIGVGLLAFVVVALDSFVKAFFVLLAFVLIQQIEGNIVKPALAKKVIGIPIFIVLISLTVGGTLFGIMGAFLAIPMAAIAYEFMGDFLKERRKNG